MLKCSVYNIATNICCIIVIFQTHCTSTKIHQFYCKIHHKSIKEINGFYFLKEQNLFHIKHNKFLNLQNVSLDCNKKDVSLMIDVVKNNVILKQIFPT
jgi:hypothetical protein